MRARTVQPGWSFEYVMWIFTRISGLALVLLAVFGVVSALIMGARTQMDLPTLMRWSFFPNPNHVVNSNIPDVAVGWATAYWQIMQMLIIFFAVTALVVFRLSSGAKVDQKKSRVITVGTVAPLKQDLEIRLTYTADITPNQLVNIFSRVDGYIAKLYVDKGDLVKANQLLVEIDHQDYLHAVNQAKANLAAARAKVTQQDASVRNAKLTLERMQALIKDQFVSQQDLDNAQVNSDAAVAALESLRAQVKQMEVALAQAEHGSIGLGPAEQGRDHLGPATVRHGDVVAPVPERIGDHTGRQHAHRIGVGLSGREQRQVRRDLDERRSPLAIVSERVAQAGNGGHLEHVVERRAPEVRVDEHRSPSALGHDHRAVADFLMPGKTSLAAGLDAAP